MAERSFGAGAIWAYVRLGWRRALAERAALAGRLLLYVLILVIFRQIWMATPLDELTTQTLSAADLLWYVAITEWIVFAAGNPYRSVEEQILSGDIESALVRPVPFAVATLAEWAGGAAFNLLAIGACGLATAAMLTGTVPLAAATLPPLLLSAGIACAIALLFQLQVGYAAAWIGSAAPVFWIWQKLLFVFGGLLLPLTLYPEPLRDAAAAGPFAAMLFAPASLVLGEPHTAAQTIGVQFAWLILLALATLLLDRAAATRVAGGGR